MLSWFTWWRTRMRTYRTFQSRISPVKKCCDTCKYADFDRTPTGKVSKKYPRGRCTYPLTDIFNSIIPKLPSSVPLRTLPVLCTYGIGGTDGQNCPVWASTKPEPLTQCAASWKDGECNSHHCPQIMNPLLTEKQKEDPYQ